MNSVLSVNQNNGILGGMRTKDVMGLGVLAMRDTVVGRLSSIEEISCST
jgi:hypothetical protein